MKKIILAFCFVLISGSVCFGNKIKSILEDSDNVDFIVRMSEEYNTDYYTTLSFVYFIENCEKYNILMGLMTVEQFSELLEEEKNGTGNYGLKKFVSYENKPIIGFLNYLDSLKNIKKDERLKILEENFGMAAEAVFNLSEINQKECMNKFNKTIKESGFKNPSDFNNYISKLADE